MTEQEVKWLKEKLRDFPGFAKEFLKIRNKDGELAPLVLNPAQQIVYNRIKEIELKGKPLRVIILKARQKGISTFFEAYMFMRTTFNANRKAAIVCHEKTATQNLYEMTQRYYDNLPQVLKPELTKKNIQGLVYGKLGSSIMCDTAEKGDVGSSQTLQDLHLSEVAKWRDAKTTLTSLLQTVPNKPNTMVIMESTAFGLGGEFYNRWMQAKEGKSNYIPIFLSWLIDDEYTLPFEEERQKEHFIRTLDETERSLLSAGATYEHLNWRRNIAIPDNCGNDPEIFKQEYPSSDLEAFLGSGRPFFNASTCQKQFYQFYNNTPKKGDLIYNSGKKAVTFVENPHGYVQILGEIEQTKEEYFRYAAGADIAEGLAQGDYSVVYVIDRKTRQVVLVWHGHISPSQFGEEWHKLQLFLGGQQNFCICPEHNNQGSTSISTAYNLGVNMYYRQSFTKGYAVQQEELGFKTSGASKMRILNMLDSVIRENEIKIPDKEFWGESLTFVRNDKGTPSAEGKDKDPSTKNFDDRVMAMALAVECDLWLPPYSAPKEKTRYARQGVITSSYGIIKGRTKF